MPSYWLLLDGKPVGPYEPAALKALPGFGPGSMVCPAGATDAAAWKPALFFPELAPAGAAGITLAPPPPKPAGAPPPAPAAAAPASAPAAAPADERPDASAKLILVADDDDAIRDFVEMTLQLQGFRVVTARDGRDALEKIAAAKPDLVVTDLMMPGLGGYEFLRELQAAGAKRLPVFVITGSVLDDSTVGMIRAEANVVEFVPKPIKVPAFVAALHKTLGTRPKA